MENLARTRTLPALQTSGKVRVAAARDLLGHNFLSFKALGASTRNVCISSVLPHRPLLVPPSLLLILYWPTAIQFNQRIGTRVS